MYCHTHKAVDLRDVVTSLDTVFFTLPHHSPLSNKLINLTPFFCFPENIRRMHANIAK